MGRKKGNNGQKRKSGKCIRGKIDFFVGSPLDNHFKKLQYMLDHDIFIPEDMLKQQRTEFKKMAAIRFADGLSRGGYYEPITQETKQLIKDNLCLLRNHTYAHANVDCIISYYNSVKRPSNAKYNKVRLAKKELQHAFKDSLKAADYYIKPFIRLTKWKHKKESRELYKKFKDLRSSIVFLGFFFKKYYFSRIPVTLNVEAYNAALSLDSRIKNLYTYYELNDQYQRNNKTYLRLISQECAAFLIIQMLKMRDN